MNRLTKNALIFIVFVLCITYFTNVALSECGSKGECTVSGKDGRICTPDDAILATECIYCGDIYDYDCDECDCVLNDYARTGIIIGSIVWFNCITCMCLRMLSSKMLFMLLLQ